eukprot:3261196-Rhodomonas_salina.1
MGYVLPRTLCSGSFSSCATAPASQSSPQSVHTLVVCGAVLTKRSGDQIRDPQCHIPLRHRHATTSAAHDADHQLRLVASALSRSALSYTHRNSNPARSEDSFSFAHCFDVVHVGGDVMLTSAIPRISLSVGAFSL